MTEPLRGSDEEVRLRDLLKPVARRRSSLRKCLSVAFTCQDELALTRALRSTWPEILFGGTFQDGEWAVVQPVESLDGRRDSRGVNAFLPEPGWDWARLKPVRSLSDSPRGYPRTGFLYISCCGPSICDEDGRPLVKAPPGSVFHASYFRGDDGHRAFLRKAWRLIDGISGREVDDLDDCGRRVQARVRPPQARFGYDALDWCRQRPERRVLRRYRPCDDWARPASPWYEGPAGP